MSVRSMCSTVLGVCTLVVSLAACGGSSSANGLITCQPNGSWGPVPANLKAEVFATQFGVSVEQVQRGSTGFADCEQPFALSDITSPERGSVSVTGIGPRCPVYGIGGNATPTDETASTVMALCPEE